MNKYQQEYIGKNVQVKIDKKEIKGTIIDETKNTFKVQTNKKTITLLKNKKQFIIDGKKINGEKITKKPEERIKLK